jgi:hypothetical protein
MRASVGVSVSVRRILRGVVVGSLVAACTGTAGAAPEALDLPAGATVHFFGDSIFKGWGFGKYDEPSPLCRIQDICTLLARDNLTAPPRISRLAPRAVEDGKRYGEEPGALVKARIGEGEIGPDDWIVYEDAGPHGASYHDYRRKLAGICQAAAGANRRVILMTMFDYRPSIPDSAYDAPTRDVPGRSINDAIRDEAAAQRVACLDMNGFMDRLQEALQGQGWGSTCHRDGIHPNVFGNLLMAFVLLRALGAEVADWKLDAVEARFRHPATGGDVPAMTAWTWPRDPSDEDRRVLVGAIRRIAVEGPLMAR